MAAMSSVHTEIEPAGAPKHDDAILVPIAQGVNEGKAESGLTF